MHLATFNQAAPEQLLPLLHNCVQIAVWAEQLLAARPFPSQAALLQYAAQASQNWSWQQIEQALSTHPRIGERQAKQQLNAQEQHFSAQEQAGVAQDEITQHALLQGNMAYEQKFGFIFLIKAAGRSSDEILSALQQRLTHDLDTEKQIVHEQLAAIALLRLAQEIAA